MVTSIQDVQADTVRYIKTGMGCLDNVLSGGIPRKGVSLWSGSPGVGKTRGCISVASNMNLIGEKVLFFQTEASASQFKNWILRPIMFPDKFLVSESFALDQQMQEIRQTRPDVVFVDSVNMIDRFRFGAKDVVQSYRGVARDVDCAIVFISQLNKEGQEKGNNDLVYLVDTVCKLKKFTPEEEAMLIQKHQHELTVPIKNMFIFNVGKNRFRRGSPPENCVLFHDDYGIQDFMTVH